MTNDFECRNDHSQPQHHQCDPGNSTNDQDDNSRMFAHAAILSAVVWGRKGEREARTAAEKRSRAHTAEGLKAQENDGKGRAIPGESGTE
jgi:hypothetical protein